MLYLAIDQHGKQLTVNLRNEEGAVVERRQVSTKWGAVEGYFRELAERSAADGGYVALVEVCGFNDWLLERLPGWGCRQVLLVQPERRSRQKTDRRDANRLGELLWVNRQRLLSGQRVQGLRQVHWPSAIEREDRRLTSLRRELGARRTRILNRIQHLLLRHNIKQEMPTRGLQTVATRRWLARLTLVRIDRLDLDQLREDWQSCDKHLKQVNEEIRVRYDQHPTASIVATMPGCGPYTALALAARIGSIARFPSPRSLANYFGLTPGCRNSGEATQRLGSITKAGSPLARFLLGQIVLHVLRRDRWMRAWYQRIKQRRGAKIARVAVMRRATTILWQMLTRQEAYCLGGPPRLRLSARAAAGPVGLGAPVRGRDHQDPKVPSLDPSPFPSSLSRGNKEQALS